MSGPAEIDAEFEAHFWPVYPRKVAKGTARKCYRTARKRASFELIMTGLRRFVPIATDKETRFIPHASTWLNGERWLDEPGPTPACKPEEGDSHKRLRALLDLALKGIRGTWFGPDIVRRGVQEGLISEEQARRLWH